MTLATYYDGLNVLVTGGAGFIGSHLTQKLVELGAQVTVLDDLSTGSLDNLEDVKEKITFIHDSIKNHDACMHAVECAQVIFHLAACVSVVQSMEHPDVCYATNVTGTLNMLEAAKRCKAERLILSSSSAVYGVSDEPCKEDDVCQPLSPYGMSKLIAEHACQAYAHEVETVRLRYFNVYGERQDPFGEYAAVIPKFRYLMEHNEPITIFGDGLQTRDFIHVSEVVNANLNAGMIDGTVVAGKVFNVATGNSVTLLDLIEHLKADFSDYSRPIAFMPARAADIRHSGAICTKWQNIIKLNQI